MRREEGWAVLRSDDASSLHRSTLCQPTRVSLSAIRNDYKLLVGPLVWVGEPTVPARHAPASRLRPGTRAR